MSLTRLPNGRWRARIWHEGRNQSVPKILALPATSFRTRREAQDAYDKAKQRLRDHRSGSDMTVWAFWERWTTDEMFARPKRSTDIHNRERTRAFAKQHAVMLLRDVTRETAGDWLMGGQRKNTVPALRAMWNDAIRAGQVHSNPFANWRIARTRGNRDVQPPGEEMVRRLIRKAGELSGPYFAAWLQVAAFTGMRPGELDALRWPNVDFEGGRIRVVEQFSPGSRSFTLPKNGKRRDAPLTPQARGALVGLPRSREFVFVNLRGHHWTASARAYHWRSVASACNCPATLYLATRHHAGWYMLNVLGLSAAEVAIALGHEDGGRLVEQLYGHRDKDRTLSRVVEAYERRANVVPLLRLAEDA